MGRSNRTRSRTNANRRLRSVIQSAPTFHHPLPYDTINVVRQLNKLAPSLSLPNRRLTYPTPSQPTPFSAPGRAGRDDRNGAGRSGNAAIRQALRHQAPISVFDAPRSDEERATMVCVRRSQRREVLHALGKTGQGGQKSPKYNWQSKIHCKGRK